MYGLGEGGMNEQRAERAKEKGEGEERRVFFFLCSRRMGISPRCKLARGSPTDKKPSKQHPWFDQTKSHSGLDLKNKRATCKSCII